MIPEQKVIKESSCYSFLVGLISSAIFLSRHPEINDILIQILDWNSLVD